MQNQANKLVLWLRIPRSQAGCIAQLLDNGQYLFDGLLRDIIFTVKTRETVVTETPASLATSRW